LEGALNEFEACVNEFSVTPWKRELFCRFIKAEDAERLQRVMDLSTKLHGEVNSLYDLVFAFLECGKIRQAKKILEVPNSNAHDISRVDFAKIVSFS
jgi:leucine-rich PPR motif-containing protein